MISPDDVVVVQYQGSFLIVPTTFAGYNVFQYAKEGLKACPDARKILWNDKVRHLKVSGESVVVDLG